MLKTLIFISFLVLLTPAYALDQPDTIKSEAKQMNIKIEKAWIRTCLENRNTALYMNIINSGDQLVNLVEIKSSLTPEIQLHDTHNNGNITGMVELNILPIDANTVTQLKTGKEHIMLMHLKRALKQGDNVDIFLKFDNGQIIKIKVPVKNSEHECNLEMSEDQIVETIVPDRTNDCACQPEPDKGAADNTNVTSKNNECECQCK